MTNSPDARAALDTSNEPSNALRKLSTAALDAGQIGENGVFRHYTREAANNIAAGDMIVFGPFKEQWVKAPTDTYQTLFVAYHDIKNGENYTVNLKFDGAGWRQVP